MKKLGFLVLLAVVLGLASFAQNTEVVDFKKVSSSEVPEEVVAGVSEDFGDYEVEEYALIPVEVYQEEWSVSETNTLDDDSKGMDHYVVTLKGDGIKGHVVYDKDGNLLAYKAAITDEALPEKIVGTIGEKYPGWTITKDQEIFKSKRHAKEHFYKVKITKAKKHKMLFFDNYGTFLKEG